MAIWDNKTHSQKDIPLEEKREEMRYIEEKREEMRSLWRKAVEDVKLVVGFEADAANCLACYGFDSRFPFTAQRYIVPELEDHIRVNERMNKFWRSFINLVKWDVSESKTAVDDH
jgi:hypothetical protein